MESKDANEEIQRVAAAIRVYLSARPEAKDTAEGIAQWWVRGEVPTVLKALSVLLSEGMIVKRGNVYYLKHKPYPERRSQ